MFNGAGTDHSWGGNHMLLGGSIKGGNIHGNYPPLNMPTPGKPNDYILDSRGSLLPALFSSSEQGIVSDCTGHHALPLHYPKARKGL